MNCSRASERYFLVPDLLLAPFFFSLYWSIVSFKPLQFQSSISLSPYRSNINPLTFIHHDQSPQLPSSLIIFFSNSIEKRPRLLFSTSAFHLVGIIIHIPAPLSRSHTFHAAYFYKLHQSRRLSLLFRAFEHHSAFSLKRRKGKRWRGEGEVRS